MKTKNLLFLLAIAGITIFASCKKDEGTPDPLTKEEAQAAFVEVEGDFTGILTVLDEANGPSVQESFNDYGFPSIPMKSIAERPESIQKDLFNKVQPSFAKGQYEYDPYVDFNFEDYIGTWTYVQGTWNHTSTPTDKVVLVIPYGDGGTATLTYSDYQSKPLGDGFYTSNLKAELKISTQIAPVMSWVYTATKTLTSVSYKFVYTFGAYTKTKTFARVGGGYTKPSSSNLTYSYSVSWKKDGEVIYAKSFNIDATYNNDQTYSVSVEGNVRVMSIVTKWNMNFSDTTDYSNPNNYITISVWTTDGAKVADIIFKPVPVKTEYMMYLVFTDGTEVPLSDYLENLGYEIHDFTWFIRYYAMD